jgi:hypothetical protein
MNTTRNQIATALMDVRRAYRLVQTYQPSRDEPDPASFKPAEECATMLRVGLWTAATSSPDWDEAVRERGGENKVREGQTYTLKLKGTEYTYQFFLVDIADLVDEPAVKAKFLQPIEDWLANLAPQL